MASRGGKIASISSGRIILQNLMAKRAAELARKKYGIELVDVKIKRINYERSVQSKVFERMISERKKIAEKIRSVGQGKRAQIEGRTERTLRQIRSEAYEKVQAVKGKADADASDIYAAAYGSDTGFYSFVKSLETYEKTLPGKAMLLLSTDSEYFMFSW